MPDPVILPALSSSRIQYRHQGALLSWLGYAGDVGQCSLAPCIELWGMWIANTKSAPGSAKLIHALLERKVRLCH